MATIAEEEKRKRGAAQSGADQIPGGAPLGWEGGTGSPVEGGALSRNINNSLNALGGMGVVASVPIKGAAMAGGAMNAPPVLQSAVPRLGMARPAADWVAGMGSGAMAAPAVNAVPQSAGLAPKVVAGLYEGSQANALAGGARALGGASAMATNADAQRPGVPQEGQAQAPSAPSEYGRQMGQVGGFFLDLAKHAVSAPGYGFNRAAGPEAASPAGQPGTPPAQYTTRMKPEQYGARAATSATPTTAGPAGAEQPAGQPENMPKLNEVTGLSSAERMAMDQRTHDINMQSMKLRQQLVDGASGALSAPADGSQPAQARHSGNDWQARNNLRNLEVSASSITNKDGRRGPSAAQAAYYDALGRDHAVMMGSDPGTIARGRDAAAMQGDAMRLQGVTAQTAAQMMANGQRNAIDQQRLGLEATAQGFKTRAAQSLEAAQQAVMGAKTPEEQAAANKRLAALMGKDQSRMQVVNLPDSMSADGFQKLSGGQAVLRENADGTVTRVPVGDQAAKPARAPGTVSEVNGKRAVWDGSKWIPQ